MKKSVEAIPVYDRPREKAIKNGIESLTDRELLAVVLKCGTKNQSVFEVVDIIMEKYINFNNLINCSYDELITINGIKEAKALEILGIIEIAKRVQKNKLQGVKKITHPDDIYNQFSIFIKEEKQEKFMVIFLNIKSHIIKYETLFVGGVNSSIVDVNLILKKAIGCSACKIVCLHNHPSGDTTPSNQDILVTNKIKKCCEVFDIQLLDNIIIGKDNYFSFKMMSLI